MEPRSIVVCGNSLVVVFPGMGEWLEKKKKVIIHGSLMMFKLPDNLILNDRIQLSRYFATITIY